MFGTAFLMVLLLLMHLTHVDTVRIPETKRSHLSYRNDIRRIGPVNIRAVCILPLLFYSVPRIHFARFPSLVSFNIGVSFRSSSPFRNSFIHISMKTLCMRTVICFCYKSSMTHVIDLTPSSLDASQKDL
jgi:hypothetical protein